MGRDFRGLGSRRARGWIAGIALAVGIVAGAALLRARAVRVAPTGAAPAAAIGGPASVLEEPAQEPGAVGRSARSLARVTDDAAAASAAAATRSLRLRSSLGLIPLEARVRAAGAEVTVIEGTRRYDCLAVDVPAGVREVSAPGHTWRALADEEEDVLLEPAGSIVLHGTDLDARVLEFDVAFEPFTAERTDERLHEGLGHFARTAPDVRAIALELDAIPPALDPFSVMVLFETGEWLDLRPDLRRAAHWRIDVDELVPPASTAATVAGRVEVRLPAGLAASGELDLLVRSRRPQPTTADHGWRRLDTGDSTLSALLSSHAPVPVHAEVMAGADGWTIVWRAQAGHDTLLMALARDSGCFGAVFVDDAAPEAQVQLQLPVDVRLRAEPGTGSPAGWRVGLSLDSRAADGRWHSLAHSAFDVPSDGVERVRRLPAQVDDIHWLREWQGARVVTPDVGRVEGSAFADGHPVQQLTAIPVPGDVAWECGFLVATAVREHLAATVVFGGAVPDELTAPGTGDLFVETQLGVAQIDVVHGPSGDAASLRLAFEDPWGAAPRLRGQYSDAEEPYAVLDVASFSELPAHVVWQPHVGERTFACTHVAGRLAIDHVLDLRTFDVPIGAPPPQHANLRAVWRDGAWAGLAGYARFDRRAPDRLRGLRAPVGSEVTVVYHEPDGETRTVTRRTWLVHAVPSD